MISRLLSSQITDKLFKRKTLVVTGPRQVGKTTLIHHIVNGSDVNCLVLDGDDPATRNLLAEPNLKQLEQIIGKHNLLFIDEAQRIPSIGLTAKIINDQLREVQLILSGSSSFDLNNVMSEPLTGRKWTFELFPISWSEYVLHVGLVQATQELEQRLVYGMYPDVLMNPKEQRETLLELSDSYLFKDVMIYANIRKPDMIQKLLRALAFQVGSEVSMNEVGQLIGLDPKTVGHYIDVLEKAYVLFRISPFSGNLRNEIKSKAKIYFYDNGMRNAAIGQFSPLGARQDIGALWENFMISERLKHLRYSKSHATMHFWRTKQQQEIDLVEVRDGQITGTEFKWNPLQKVRFSKTFTGAYGDDVQAIHRENFGEFIGL